MARVAPSDKYQVDQDQVAADQPSSKLEACWWQISSRCYALVTHRRFDHVVLCLILLNSVCLALDDPTGLHPDRQEVVKWGEMIFQLLFTLELILKVLAYGCNMETGYLSDPWNRLDAFIVIMGFVEWIVGDAAGGLSAVRCVRALRPLRTINRLPQLKVIIETLLSSLPQLFHVLQLCGFVYSLFALIGLQIWSGDGMHSNCYSQNTGSMMLTDDGDLQLCNPDDGVYNCPAEYSCIMYWSVPFSGIISFDNFGTALTLAFWVASLESWTNVVVYVEDQSDWAELWILIFWFVAVVLIGGGLCMNLAPAVLKACFSDVAESHEDADAKTDSPEEDVLVEEAQKCLTEDLYKFEDDSGDELERMAEELVASSPCSSAAPSSANLSMVEGFEPDPCSSSTQSGGYYGSGIGTDLSQPEELGGVGSGTGMEQTDPHEPGSTPIETFEKGELEDEVDKMLDELKFDDNPPLEAKWGSRAERRRGKSRSVTNANLAALEDANKQAQTTAAIEKQEACDEEDAEEGPALACDCGLSRVCYTVAVSMSFSNFFFLMICLNTIILTIDSNDLDDTGDLVMKVFNYFFTAIFTIELAIKLIAFGHHFFTDSLNVFDFIIVAVSLLEVALADGSSSTGILRMLRMLRMARLLKVVRMSRSIGATRVVLSVLFAMLPTLQYIGLLCFLTAFVFAILGMGLFGGKMSFPNKGVPDANFDHFGWAFLTTFQLITLEDWPVVFESTKNATTWASILYVLLVVVIGNFVLLNLMLAIMLAFFEDPDMAAQITRKGVIIEGGGVATNMGMSGSMEPEVEDEPPIDKTVAPEIEMEQVSEDTIANGWCQLHKDKGSSICIRLFCQWLVGKPMVTTTIEIMIVINCIIMAVDPNQNIFALRIVDIVFTGIFVLEVIFKMVGFTPKLYWQDPANKLDFVVVSISLLSLLLTPLEMGFLKALRAARVIRPLRLITRSEGMMLVASSLLQSIPGMLNVGLVCFMGWLVFGILGMAFFKGMEGGYCSNSADVYSTEDSCTGMFTNEYGTLVERSWITTDAKFSNTIVAWLTLFQLASLEGWVDIMYYYTKHPDGTYFASFFFLAWVMLSNWLLVNLWVGVIWINFVAISEERQGWAFLTDAQREWVVSQRRALVLEPSQSVLRPYRVDWFRRLCYDIATNVWYQNYIASCIILNVATIAMTHHGQDDTWDTTIIAVNTFFSVNFFIESMLKIAGFHWNGYWRDSWNRFEFVLAMYVFGDLAVLVVTLLPSVDIPDSGLVKLALRLVVVTRCLRIIRLMRRLHGVSTMLFTLYQALPAVCNIGLLLIVLLYMYAVAGVILFQDVLERGGITHMHNFKHFGSSCWTIFLICTGDIWPDMMYNCMYDGDECSDERGDCGFPLAALYYVSLIVFVTFLLLNMFVTILVDQFIEARRVYLGRVTVNDLELFRKMWAFYDREGIGYIAPHHLSSLLIELPQPLGLDVSEEVRTDMNAMRGLSLRAISEMELSDHDGCAHFAEVLYQLCQRAHTPEILGTRNIDLLYSLVEEQRQAAIPSVAASPGQNIELGFQGTIDERLAASVVIRYIWRKNYVNNLKRGVIPSNISDDFKSGVMDTKQGRDHAAATLLQTCYTIWGGLTSKTECKETSDVGVDISTVTPS